MKSITPGERVLVTGGTGSLGHALTERLLATGAKVRIFSRDEKKQYDMAKLYPECEYHLGDIRDAGTLRDAVRDVDVVIHGASLKYVNISELQPLEYVQTNIDGTINLMQAVLDERRVRSCVGISSDKACLPVNTYGLTKAVLEKLMLEGTKRQGDFPTTVFNVARYGNVLGTRGSVVPFWREKLAQGVPLPITNPEMTRFFFTLDEATDLIDFCLLQEEGLIISKRMNACSLADLAAAMEDDHGHVIVGQRPGEKLHEQLLSEDEMARTSLVLDDSGDHFWVFDPSGKRVDWDESTTEISEYNSQNAPQLTVPEIQELLSKVD